MLIEHYRIPNTVLNKEYSLCHLIPTTHGNACCPSIHTSKPTDSGNLLSKALARSIAGARAFYITLAFRRILYFYWTPVQLSPTKPPH